MLRKNHRFVCVIFKSILSFAFLCNSPLGSSEEGLYTAKDTRVPGSIEIAGESVLQMVLLGSGQVVQQKDYEGYVRSFAGENFTLHLAIEKVKKCKERGLSSCEIPYRSYGSAFLTDDGLNLWTARHVLEPQLGRELQFELYNSDGVKVFDTTDRTKDKVSIVYVGQEDLIQKRHNGKYIVAPDLKKLSSDYIKLRLNHSLAIRPLRIASRKAQVNERVYAIGYANMTHRGLNSNSSIQKRSRVGIGQVSPYVQRQPNENEAQKQNRLALEDFSSHHLLVMDLDGLPGQSGSPVLNQSGEVVGIFCAGNATIQGRTSLQGLGPHFEGIAKNGH